MCFSAGASFGAGVILSAIGIASLKKTNEPSQYAFASIPLIFAVQQISEGFLWIALSNEGYARMENISTYIFLFFAQIVWPSWVPLAVLKFEPDIKRKKILRLLFGIGLVVSAYMAYCLIAFPVDALLIGNHISYIQNYPVTAGRFGGVLYLIASITPALVSSIKKMPALGFAILISYVIALAFYKGYIVSVWCFFAAVISGIVYFILPRVENTVKLGEA
jgi:hypothetical protein